MNKWVMIAGVAAIALVIGIFVISSNKGSDSSPDNSSTVAEPSSGTLTESPPEQLDNSRPWLGADTSTAPNPVQTNLETEETNSSVGMQDLGSDSVRDNTAEVVESFTQDLNGTQIPLHYTIDKIDTQMDFISYVKYRSVTDTGVEMYWLDADFKGKKTYVQVPLKVFKELDEQGIVPVEVEVAKIKHTDGTTSEVVTHFTVVDYEVRKK